MAEAPEGKKRIQQQKWNKAGQRLTPELVLDRIASGYSCQDIATEFGYKTYHGFYAKLRKWQRRFPDFRDQYGILRGNPGLKEVVKDARTILRRVQSREDAPLSYEPAHRFAFEFRRSGSFVDAAKVAYPDRNDSTVYVKRLIDPEDELYDKTFAAVWAILEVERDENLSSKAWEQALVAGKADMVRFLYADRFQKGKTTEQRARFEFNEKGQLTALELAEKILVKGMSAGEALGESALTGEPRGVPEAADDTGGFAETGEDESPAALLPS